MNISSINQFNIEVFIQDPTWRLINPNLIIKDGPYILENERVFFYDSDFETTFYFYFLIDRNLESSIAPILFPIIIFILLILVHIRTFPTFKNENFLNVIQKKQIDEENEKK